MDGEKMTLALAWRSEGRVHLASDSRISFGARPPVDLGVKVMRLPICIRGQDLGPDNLPAIIFQHNYGFVYAGSVVSSSTFKSFIEDVLIDAQYVPFYEQLSFSSICELVVDFAGRISSELVRTLFEAGRYTFIMTGYCPARGTIRAAMFNLTQRDGATIPEWQAIIEEDGDCAPVGTGRDAFERLIPGKVGGRDQVLLALDQVIRDPDVPSVGGDIQYGCFDTGGNFEVFGVIRISEERAQDGERVYGPQTVHEHRFRGFDVLSGWELSHGFWPVARWIELEVPSSPESNARFVERCRALLRGPFRALEGGDE